MLFDWLGRASAADQPAPFVDKAEQVARCTLECLLERVPVEPFDPDYAALVEEALFTSSPRARPGDQSAFG